MYFDRAKAFGCIASSKRWVTVPCPICRKRMKLPAYGMDFCQLLKVQPQQSPSCLSHEDLDQSPVRAASVHVQYAASSSHCDELLDTRRAASKLQPSSSCEWRRWDICWAKCDGYPYWPGVIVELRLHDELACVAFYDSSVDVAEAQWFSTQDGSMRAYAFNRHL